MGSPAMRALIHEIKHRYQDRYILFDGPPVLSGADALILSRHVDGVILVVEYNRTHRDELEKTFELLDKVNIVGTVLNKTPVPKNGKYPYRR
jgi:non-specific protein-tyrosine kinase